jgi:hypothetical protein
MCPVFFNNLKNAQLSPDLQKLTENIIKTK